MIGVATEETTGSDRVPDLKDYDASLWLERHFFNESEMALFPECMLQCARNSLDTADIVRDAIFRQLIGRRPVTKYVRLISLGKQQ
jgi:hypothetical protein